jgi:hypothetical protein
MFFLLLSNILLFPTILFPTLLFIPINIPASPILSCLLNSSHVPPHSLSHSLPTPHTSNPGILVESSRHIFIFWRCVYVLRFIRND